MPNNKTHNADTKNTTGDSKNNNADFKMNRAESKNNKVDWRHSHSDLKNNHSDSKNNADVHLQGDGGIDHVQHSSGAAPPPERQYSQQFSHNGLQERPTLFVIKRNWVDFMEEKVVYSNRNLVGFLSKRSKSLGDWFPLRCIQLPENAAPQKGGEVNLTLGGIDLNSSGSVVVKADKKLITVLSPDGRDSRAETSEDLVEWKDALEAALSNAPSAATGQRQNGIAKNEKGDIADGSYEQSKDQSPRKSTVLGRPILLALEDVDGTPSLLEKALCYVEDFGVNVEGILRQAADVDDVLNRILEYEQGKTELTEEEDGHVIGDCIKFVLRELPSPPVPTSCCSALLEAYKTDQATRVSAIRSAICDTFPEPNRRLLQRILIMMEAVAENKAVNQMSVSAVAACMSPLLLRPLLAGEVDLGKGTDMGGDGSAQLLQAAAAANHAQAICITLVEEYDKIFGEEDMLSELYSDSDDYDSESGSDKYYEEDEYSEDDDDENISEGSCSCEETERGSSSSYSESGDNDDHSKGSGCSNSTSSEVSNHSKDSVSRKKTIRRRISVKKGSPLESIAYITEQQAEILMLESNKAKLKERIEAEARRNAILKEDLVSKKKALEMRSVAHLEELSQLEEELQKVPLLDSADEKTNADPIDIDQSEASDPGLQYNQLHEINSHVTRDTSNQEPLPPDHEKKKDKEKDRESTTTSHKNMGTHFSKQHSDKHHFHSFSSNHYERGMHKSISSRRPPSKPEPANTTSALSKVTNRLNFLKELLHQISDDLQDDDKDHKNHKHRGSRKWLESTQASDEPHTQSSDKEKSSDTHSHSQKEGSSQQRDDSMDKGRSEDQSSNQSQGKNLTR